MKICLYEYYYKCTMQINIALYMCISFTNILVLTLKSILISMLSLSFFLYLSRDVQFLQFNITIEEKSSRQLYQKHLFVFLLWNRSLSGSFARFKLNIICLIISWLWLKIQLLLDAINLQNISSRYFLYAYYCESTWNNFTVNITLWLI